MQLMRSLNSKGLDKYRTYISDLRDNPLLSLPQELINDDNFSSEISDAISLESRSFKTKLEISKYLAPIIEKISSPDKYKDVGIWSWLSAFYWDSVCPKNKRQERTPGREYRYILAGKEWRHFYRHLLASPVRTYTFHKNSAMVLLCGPIDRMGDYVEQLASRQELAANQGVIEAATQLYYDSKTLKTKSGAAPNKRKPGTLRRYIDIIQQLDLTYDLYSMNGDQVITLLPKEFSSFLTQ